MRVRCNGIDVRYRLQGEGAPVVFVHGVGGSLESWHPVLAALPPRYRMLSYDLRGHGESGKPPGPYSLDLFVADLAALLEQVSIERAALVGFSLGGLIGQAFALAHPGRLTKLVILSAVAGRTADERRRILERAARLEREGARSTVGAALERWFTPEFRAAHPEVIEARRRRVEANDPAGYAAAYRVFAESDLAERLHAIAVPTFVATGEDDVGSTPRMARLMHERIAGSRLCILPGLRHDLLTEAPAGVACRLDDFLSGSRLSG